MTFDKTIEHFISIFKSQISKASQTGPRICTGPDKYGLDFSGSIRGRNFKGLSIVQIFNGSVRGSEFSVRIIHTVPNHGPKTQIRTDNPYHRPYLTISGRQSAKTMFSSSPDVSILEKIGQDVNGLSRPKSGEGWTYCSSVGANRILISVFLNALECFERETIPG